MLATGLKLAHAEDGLPSRHLVSVRENHCAVLALVRLSGRSGVEVKWLLRDAWESAYGDSKTPRFHTNTELWGNGVLLSVLDHLPYIMKRISDPPRTVADCLPFAPCMVGWPGHVAALVGDTLYDDPAKDRRLDPVTEVWKWVL